MFKKIKQRSFKKIIQKNLKQRDFSEMNGVVQTMGFLVSEDTFKDLEKLHNTASFYGLQPKDVKVFSFVTLSKSAPSLRQNQVSNKDFSWSGTLNNQNAREFLDIPFDVLVGYYEGQHQFLDLMVTQSQAKFKVGIAKADPDLFDLLIAVALKDYEAFKIELKKYLHVLGKL